MDRYICELLAKSGFHSEGGPNNVSLYNPFRNAQRIKLGKNIVFCPMCYLSVNDRCLEDTSRSFNIHVEDEVRIGDRSQIEARHFIWIKRAAVLESNVYLSDITHAYEDIEACVVHQGMKPGGELIIGEGALIGANAVISGDLTIGNGAVVAPNTVLNNMNVPAHSVVAGNPADLIRLYDYDTEQWVNVKDTSAEQLETLQLQRE
jgi:acetyltransferase-like isoleucine patch superfamily enzyme